MKKEYANFLKQKCWDFYGTLTTKYRLTKQAARNAITRFFKFASSVFRKIQLFWISEEYSLIEGFHIHLLIKCEADMSSDAKARVLLITWKKVTGSESTVEVICKFRKYKKDGGADEYVTKKITSRLVDYDFFGDW